uniref:ShKT domain-containing protein n=1 Tax=Romanomermis culicivorax TaxID=13658 RepID=A0A915K057_ROMCU
MSKYDILVVYHTPEYAPTAHFCPSFFPYHREYLKNFELAIQAIEPGLGVPYWDMTLDDRLPDPRHSILWTEEFFGNGEGLLKNGPFAHFFPRPDALVPALVNHTKLERDVGKNSLGALLGDEYIAELLGKKNFSQFDYCVDPFLELVHGSIHFYIGGHMSDTRVAPNDPVFFFIHSFIDYIWEQWRHEKQTRRQRETEFVEKKGDCNIYCSITDQLKPFPVKEIEGLSNYYTDKLYRYEPRPYCNAKRRHCGSPYIFCDIKRYICLSKIRIGGNCSGYEGTDICYKSKCRDGRCAEESFQKIDVNDGFWSHENEFEGLDAKRWFETGEQMSTKVQTAPTTTNHPFSRFETVWMPVTMVARRSERQSTFRYGAAKILTQHYSPINYSLEGLKARLDEWPYTVGAGFAQILDPRVFGKSEGEILVLDENENLCNPMCFNMMNVLDIFGFSDLHYEFNYLENSTTSTFLNVEIIQKSQGVHRKCDKAEFNIKITDNGFGDMPFATDITSAKFLNIRNNVQTPDKFIFICDLNVDRMTTPAITPATTTSIAASSVVTTHLPLLDGASMPGMTPLVITQSQTLLEKAKTTTSFRTSSTYDISEPPTVPTVAFGEPIGRPGQLLLPSSLGFLSALQLNLQKKIHDRSKSKSADENTAPAFAITSNTSTCLNAHFCCTWWAEIGECGKSVAVTKLCPKECKMCSNYQSKTICEDYGLDCSEWASENRCADNVPWMRENCRKSCGLCGNFDIDFKQQCANSRDCYDYHNLCDLWASERECERNSIWMNQNCPRSCNRCLY